MDILARLIEINPSVWGISLLLLNLFFLVAWTFDSREHARLKNLDISDKELLTHRLILIPSLLMELSLVLMFWFPLIMLPFFIAFYLVRTVHEYIDESHFHVNRCSPREAYLHLVMWCTVHIKTWIMFIWGFFLQYDGLFSLHISILILYTFILVGLSIITLIEFRR